MNPNEEKLINSLKSHARDYLPTLKPHPFFKDKYEVSFFYVDDHVDLLLTARALTYLATKVIDPESCDDISDRSQKVFIRQALKIVNRILPQGEVALMDHLNLYYGEERLREGLE